MVEVLQSNQTPRYVAVVRFLHPAPGVGHINKDYDFLCNVRVAENDIVVVDTTYGLQLARIVGVKKTSTAATKWLVQKIDMAEHQQRIEAEMKRAELEKSMQARAKELTKVQQYEILAEKDPIMARMVSEYKSLDASLIWEDQQPQLGDVTRAKVDEVSDVSYNDVEKG